MTAIVMPAFSGGTGGGGSVAVADNERGQVAGLAPSATADLVSSVVGTRRLRGFSVHGSTDAEAWVEIDGVPLSGIRARLSRVLMAYVILPNAEVLLPASTIKLRVQNMGTTAGDFEGTLFAEAG